MDTQTTGIYFTLITILAFLTLLLTLFIFSLLRHQKQRLKEYREQMRREVELIDRERERIAADLHDELGSGLAAIGLLLQQTSENNSSPLLEKAGVQLERQREKIKDITHNLIPRILESHGLTVALEDLFDEMRLAGNIRVSAMLLLNDASYQPAKTVHIYRIIREILTNAIRHAGATAVYIRCEQDEKKILLSIKDNGCIPNRVQVLLTLLKYPCT